MKLNVQRNNSVNNTNEKTKFTNKKYGKSDFDD